MLMMSGLQLSESRPDVDYSIYLGQEWKASYDKPGTLISNHQCWLDIFMHMYRSPPSHVSKASVRKIPFIGYMAECVGGLFMDRGSKDQKKDMIT